ncbi:MULTISPECIES: hypothetical protein [unclassified Campylobacter]|uniref:hypothetical protein n=1 Tax=unclassified Campylobacter TaxID=2593542 RepID=UPI001BD9C203|nr:MULTISPECIES: hypothetical protein [unclassified Campylobacter]MBT0879708.1 hypothetical protein [Campylobacter sp. 2018MI27]MBT0881784.1 hypothetical protein [Campylobacter sp. 2018MI13]MBT0884634.1 hypothetical protein [Campylobacter sp. 2018MI10]MBZ7976366.1 hypothetical protein [Campylobacter sp. RM12637]
MRVVLIFLALFFIACDDEKIDENYLNTPLKCSINKDICEKDFKGRKISFEIINRPIRFMEETKLIIKGLPKYDNLNLKLYGLNMDMGVINAELIRLDNGDYESEFVVSTCLLSTMRYRLELFNNDKKIKLFIDFDMKR